MFRAFLRTGTRQRVAWDREQETGMNETGEKRERGREKRLQIELFDHDGGRLSLKNGGGPSSPIHPCLPPQPHSPPFPPGANFPNYNIREYIRRRARERFREAATATEATTAAATAAGEGAASSPADLAFSAGLKELAAARRQAELARMYHRPQRSVMDVMSTEEHLRREAGRGA